MLRGLDSNRNKVTLKLINASFHRVKSEQLCDYQKFRHNL